MIRYDIDPAELIARINRLKPKWIDKACARKDAYAAAKKYVGGPEFWGEIKSVYIDLQHEKCAYCEMKLAGRTYGSKVHEVEHFRPKSRVRAWPGTIGRLKGYVAPCPTGAASDSGYYLLAYNPFNFAIACTRCNSSLKSDYFPVKGKRLGSEEDVGKLDAEQALLIYPISTIDKDPEELITFDGVMAVPKHKQGSDYERARVTIDFFDLNHQDLTTRRAEIIGPLHMALRYRVLVNALADIRAFDDHIASYVSAQSGFSSCARAFLALYGADHVRATQLGQEAEKMRPR